MKIRFAIMLFVLAIAQAVTAQTRPALSEVDRVRMAEAFRLADQLGDRLWKDWHQAPFAILLVTPTHEFLIRHPKPSSDFTRLGYDPLLKSDIYYRPRVFQTSLLATFPAVGGIPTIVVGQAENTAAKTSTPWVATLLHEHFHQLQNSQPDYYAGVQALNLARGDQTGQWMLNYDFPYESAEVNQLTAEVARRLAAALAASKTNFAARLADYQRTRQQLKAALAADDYKYLSFQLWQEGMARYTEYRMARLAAEAYRPTRAFRKLKDYTPFAAVADRLRQNITAELQNLPLKNYKRVAFYYLGAGEGLLLDRLDRQWQARYFKERFSTDSYFGK
ncbi:MAG TPA: hypothetical protein VKA60_19225 [Blastocatellia bacterium]|nr:hypothetical protein [Blastocatellia bacterium]